MPTQIEADQWGTLLKTHKPLILSGKLTGKKREAAIARACGAGAPALIISTPGFSWIPIPHLSRIIIERVSAGSYSLPKRPYLNLIYALTELARARNIPLIYGDYPLPLEYRANPKKPLKEKPAGKISILDTRSEKKEVRAISSDASVVWKAVPDELRKEIKKTIDAGGRAAVLAVRRGYAPTVVCRDCGTAVTDSYGRNLSLVTLKGERVFRSTDGTTIESAKALCKNCGSWNLIPLGIGVERVEEELKAAFPKTSILRLDQDSLSSRSPSAKLLASISEPGTILIGTESMLTLLSPEHPVDLGVIASADALLALPFWRSRERFVRIGLMFAERTNQFIVATRHEEEDAVLSALTSPTTSKFWEEELGMRKSIEVSAVRHAYRISGRGYECAHRRCAHGYHRRIRTIYPDPSCSSFNFKHQSSSGKRSSFARECMGPIPRFPNASPNYRRQSAYILTLRVFGSTVFLTRTMNR